MGPVSVSEVQHEEDRRRDEREHDREGAARAGVVLDLPAPLEPDARRHADLALHGVARLIDESDQVPTADVELHEAPQEPVLALDHRGALGEPGFR
jgi:hypothetical protein